MNRMNNQNTISEGGMESIVESEWVRFLALHSNLVDSIKGHKRAGIVLIIKAILSVKRRSFQS